MIHCHFDYATPSAFESNRQQQSLGLTADQNRAVRFHGRVNPQVPRNALTLRLVLQTLGQALWSNDRWRNEGDMQTLLDPVVTVHPDRIFFEAFTQDQSAYALVIFDRQLFLEQDEVQCGTTNIDFTPMLSAALGEMRSSRDTWLRIEAGGVEVRTEGAGGRFERNVEVPEAWVRGFLQVQEAMTLPGTRLTVRPVDLLAAIRFLAFNKGRLSPRALRYEFEPGQEARLILEPWEQVFVLKGTTHNYQEKRIIRTWGRRRLRLLDPLLPYADRVDVYLKGRAQPSFYAVHLTGATFLLGLSGWTENHWMSGDAFSLRTNPERLDRSLLTPALEQIRQAVAMGSGDLALSLGIPAEAATSLLVCLCRQGRLMYDVEQRKYRHRELFADPLDEDALFPTDPRWERARQLVEQGPVQVTSCQPRETRQTRNLPTPTGPIKKEIIHREWQVLGVVVEQPSVEIVVSDGGLIHFGTCGCRFFRDNLLNQGPCEHMAALLQVSVPLRLDLPTATAGIVGCVE
jgi:hypothetical protein